MTPKQSPTAPSGCAQLHEQYSARRAALLAKHVASERQISAKLAADIQGIRTEYARALAFHKQRVLVLGVKWGVPVTDAEIDELFANCLLLDHQTAPQETAPSRLDPHSAPPARAPKKAAPKKLRRQ